MGWPDLLTLGGLCVEIQRRFGWAGGQKGDHVRVYREFHCWLLYWNGQFRLLLSESASAFAWDVPTAAAESVRTSCKVRTSRKRPETSKCPPKNVTQTSGSELR